MVRAFVTALLLAVFAGLPISSASGQVVPQTGADLRALETRLQDRFQLLPVAQGVVLTPKFKTTVRSVEVTNRAIAVDGTVVTGAELRDKLGADADLIFQLSYLDPAMQRSLMGVSAPPLPSQPPPAEAAPAAQGYSMGVQRARQRDDVVRFAGNIVIDENETVNGDAVVIGGSAVVNGQVRGEVTVIGGSLTLGPHAEVQRDVTVVGGSLARDPGAVVLGKVSEVGVGDTVRGRRLQDRVEQVRMLRDFALSPITGLAGTLARIGLLMLLGGVVLLVARTPVQEIADRAAAEPFKSWAVGFLAEILFVPVLVLTIVVLAVSIIGIPLLLLVPVAIVASMVVFLVGFTGVAYHIGRLIEGRFAPMRDRPYLTTILGICVIVLPLLLGRAFRLVDGLGVLAGILLAAGFVVEYVAWTTGLGAAALARFDQPRPQPPAPIATP